MILDMVDMLSTSGTYTDLDSMLTSSTQFDLFRPLTDEEKEELRPALKEIAKDLRELCDYFRNKKKEQTTQCIE